ncbi:MAG: DsbA family oxidoreductase [Alphaproteobacteria bacterium]|nr:DsbA family oxidoreductase [Alphaproteobacteria bacterium]
MLIDIVSDVICPWCFIGKRRLERALQLAPQADLEITWRPFQLNPDFPPEGMDRAEYLRAKFGDANGGNMYQRLRAAAAPDGIDFAFEKIRRTPNTLKPHRLIRWAAGAGRQDAMVEALFRGYFLEGENLSDDGTLVRLAQSAGADPAAAAAYLASDQDVETIRQEDAFARQVGITGVPCFIVDRKFALSGAQPPEALIELFEHARREAESPTPDAV